MIVSGVASMPAAAQILSYEQGQVVMQRYTAVKDRRLRGYEAAGLPIGTFRLTPSLDAVAIYDDNVFAVENGAESDVLLRLEPSFTLQSSGKPNSLAVRARGRFDRYATEQTENTESWDIGSRAMLELDRDTRLRGGLIWQGNVESRRSSSVFVTTRKPVTYQQYGAGAGFTHDFTRLRSSTEVTFLRTRYDDAEQVDGTPIDMSGRDHDLYQIVERLSYAQTPSFAYFVQAQFERRDYDHAAIGRPDRDSKEVEVLAGATFEAQFPVRGEIGVGYLTRKFDNSFYRDFKRFSYNVKLEFFPSQLTTVTVAAKRRNNDSGIPNSGSSSVTDASLVIDHELRRTLIVTARADFMQAKAQNIDRLDRSYGTSLGANYRLSPNLSLTTSYEFVKRTSRGLNGFRPFTGNRILAGVTLRR